MNDAVANARAPVHSRFVTHFECSLTGERYPADAYRGLSEHGKPLFLRYDLAAIRAAVTRDDLRARAPDMWRYQELLPLPGHEAIVSLGETITPLIPAAKTAKDFGVREILVKDDGRLPTGSFKARGLAVAVSMAKHRGVKRMAIPSSGNAGAALAAYCARAGIDAYIFYPDDPPKITVSDATVSEIGFFGAKGFGVNGLINEIGPLIAAGEQAVGWLNMSTLKEPYRVEGKKTIGLEVAEQLGWELPDVIFYPTGGGTGIIAMWKVFAEMEALGWIGSKRPRFVAVQSKTCAPIVRAFDAGTKFAAPWENGWTDIPGVRVPATIGDFLILNVLRESNGFGVAIDESHVERTRHEFAARDGIHVCPEGAAQLIALQMALADGRVKKTDRVMIFNSASGMKYPIAFERRYLDLHGPIDFQKLVS